MMFRSWSPTRSVGVHRTSDDGPSVRGLLESAADRVEVMRSRGAAHRHRFALQLCALRTLGMFIDDVSKLPVRITNHVGRQLGLPPPLFLEDHERPATATEQAQRIREYLGYRPFDDAAEERLKAWLSDRVADRAAASSKSAKRRLFYRIIA